MNLSIFIIFRPENLVHGFYVDKLTVLWAFCKNNTRERKIELDFEAPLKVILNLSYYANY